MTRVLDSSKIRINYLEFSLDLECVCGNKLYLNEEKGEVTCEICNRAYFWRFDIRFYKKSDRAIELETKKYDIYGT
ncbi:MAG: hypothetical protein ACTSWE_08835 [Promethearchaeota archaeon]